MSSEWVETTLGDLITLQRGFDLPTQSRVSGSVPIMGSAGISGYHNIASTPGPCVVVGRSGVGSMGAVSYIRQDFWALNTTLFVKDFHGNDPDFIYYLLSTVNFRRFDTGSAQASLNRNVVYPHRVNVPASLKARKAIGAVLRALDDRIALLRETNATLEAIAQALFKSWFVDFDPVRAKSQGLPPAGMDEATAALFPDGLEESEIGLIPAGWHPGTLADFAELNARSWTARSCPERIWYLDLANVKDNEVAEIQEFAFGEAPSRARRVLRDGDTIVGTVRPGNRSFAFIHEPIADLTGSTGFAVLSPKTPESTALVFLAATQDTSIEHLTHIADGGAYPAVRPDAVAALPCMHCPREVLRVFDATTRPLLQKIGANQREAQTLVNLRDTLLPRLISGQLRLPEAVAEVEDIA